IFSLSTVACRPPPVEELPDDEAARALAMTVAAEFGRNRHGRMQECIIVLDERGIARPSPVPPYFAAVLEEACENSWNSLPICSGVMPMPVSVTVSVIQSRPFSAGRAQR